MKYLINCANIHSRKEFHIVLAKTLSFPDWYGHNLDALHDLLTNISEETHLILENWDTLPSSFRGFKIVFNDAGEANNNFYIEYR